METRKGDFTMKVMVAVIIGAVLTLLFAGLFQEAIKNLILRPLESGLN